MRSFLLEYSAIYTIQTAIIIFKRFIFDKHLNFENGRVFIRFFISVNDAIFVNDLNFENDRISVDGLKSVNDVFSKNDVISENVVISVNDFISVNDVISECDSIYENDLISYFECKFETILNSRVNFISESFFIFDIRSLILRFVL